MTLLDERPTTVRSAEPTGRLLRPAASGERRLSWDVIRVLAVLSVVVQHATYTAQGVMPWLAAPPFIWSVEAGANTLMVVSAFFICVTVAKRRPGRWWYQRIARLLPAYLVAVLVTYGATLVAADYGYWRPGVRDLVGNLLLVQGFDPAVTYMDHSYWTLPLQLGVFSLVALTVGLLGRDLWRRPGVLPALAWFGVITPVLLATYATGWLKFLSDGFVMWRWQLFAIGLAMWLASTRRISLTHLAALTAAGVLAEAVITPDTDSTIVLAAACLLVAAATLGPDWDFLRIGPLPRIIGWAAGVSYGVYLMNQQIGYFFAWLAQDYAGVTGWGRLLGVLVLAFVLGWLLTRCVERPAFRALTRRREGAQARGKDRAASSSISFSSGAPADTRTPVG
ncbi:acyltransferase family protein [Actinomycetospora corticicola]|uniref:Peptidoglycan/LPS O-acetylase OafA/YrhL n=1 Tax=Actinomycetospora corticicola TaxID=663602 RepID=A0A7Y9DZZ6_9PSEU|nr:acyltransferase [Actinomycetospora corticicola]NYD38547.1 peptidoglycan/LPS O-acetylase OafA/YrhL [Actinomycetospora corticicola]